MIDDNCLFCKIIKGEVPAMKLLETDTLIAIMDINPVASGHCLVITKYHAPKITDLPEEHMREILPTVKRLAAACGAEDFNVLQNNGRAAAQVVDHVHVHIIPKHQPGSGSGLVLRPSDSETYISIRAARMAHMEELRSTLKETYAEFKSRL